MDSCQTPKEINYDNCVSLVRGRSVVNNTMNENVVTQKKCEDSSNDDKIVLSDHFLINLLSRDSTKDVTVESSVEKVRTHEECEMILEQRQSSGNSRTRQDSGTSIVTSKDEFEILAEERNVTPENDIRKSVEDALPESELEARPDNVPEENMESNAHVEQSNIEKENCPRPEVEIIKEISILETSKTDNVKKEKKKKERKRNKRKKDRKNVMLPTLSGGSINRIWNGENLSGAVMQILGCKKIPGSGSHRYRLLISDGLTSCPFAKLGAQLNSLVTNKELEQYTVVQVHKCICCQVQPDRKVIILLNLTVLTPGADVGEKIGNPVNSETTTAAAANITPAITPACRVMLPILTGGSINRILNGEDVSRAVMQILGCKIVPGTALYRLLISDGLTCYPFAVLGTHLNSLVTNKELEKFTVVQVHECVCNQVQPDRKIIILLNLTVLTPGADVGEKIGNPVSSATTTPAAAAANITPVRTLSNSCGEGSNSTERVQRLEVEKKKRENDEIEDVIVENQKEIYEAMKSIQEKCDKIIDTGDVQADKIDSLINALNDVKTEISQLNQNITSFLHACA